MRHVSLRCMFTCSVMKNPFSHVNFGSVTFYDIFDSLGCEYDHRLRFCCSVHSDEILTPSTRLMKNPLVCVMTSA